MPLSPKKHAAIPSEKQNSAARSPDRTPQGYVWHETPGALASSNKKIYPNVILGENVVIEDFCVIGYPPKGKKPGELPTIIGDHTVIRSHSVIYAGCEIGSNCHISHGVYIREETRIGNNTSVGINCVIEHHNQIGNNVRIQGQAGICEHCIIEDDAWIGPRVIFTNVYHPTCERAKECLAGSIVRRGAIIGAGVAICPDLEIGAYSFLGAGSVITKSVEDYAVMFGNPAKKIETTPKLTCRYDMMDGKNPYSPQPSPSKGRAAGAGEAAALLDLGPATPPLPKTIPLCDLVAQHQSKKQELRLALDRVILNTRFIKGKEVSEFQEAFAQFCGTAHCVGTSSGTDALTLALQAVGVGAGDEVITTPHTFIATAEAILAVGARPVFVDIEDQTCNIDPAQMEKKITPRTRAILPVHLYGHPAAMQEITDLARARGLKVIGDAAQAHGAELAGRNIAQWGDAACFSFYPGKNLGAYGDAGAVVTADPEVAKRVALYTDHGRSQQKYTHKVIGGNYRLDTLQAAVLLVKLKYLAKWNDTRRRLAGLYREGLQGLPLRLPEEKEGAKHVYHQFVVRTPLRNQLLAFLKEKGIGAGIHYPVPLHLQPALQDLGYKQGDFPVTETVAGTVLSLPMFPELTDTQVGRVVDCIRSFFASQGS